MSTDNWIEANQRYLLAALSPVRHALNRYVTHLQDDVDIEKQQDMAQQILDEALSAMPAPPALTKLCVVFGLSPFERDILLLCAGMDLDGTFAALCATAQKQERNPYPTFSLALAALPHPHWDALTAAAPLRRWRLITIGSGNTLTLSPLRIDESILHYLVGISQPDERLAGIITPLSAPTHLVPSHRLLAERCTAANLFSIVFIASTLNIANVIIGEASISLLGLGVRPPGSSIGLMIADGIATLTVYPWETLLPSLVLAMIVIAFSFLGDGLRDAFDPRMKD